MTDKIKEFLKNDDAKIESLIERYPEKVPVKEAAEE